MKSLLASLFVLAMVACAPKSNQVAPIDYAAETRLRIAALDAQIAELQGVENRDEQQEDLLESLRRRRVLEQSNLENKSMAGGVKVETDLQELYEINKEAAEQDRSIGRKPGRVLINP